MEEEDFKKLAPRKYDRLMTKIEGEAEPVLRIKLIKTLDQLVIVEEKQDGADKKSYYQRKNAIHTKYNLLELKIKTDYEGLGERMEAEIFSNDINRFEVLYAEIQALLHRSGYYLEEKWVKLH